MNFQPRIAELIMMPGLKLVLKAVIFYNVSDTVPCGVIALSAANSDRGMSDAYLYP